MSLSHPSQNHQAPATPGVFHYFQSLPRELQLMVWEEFLRSADKSKPRVVLLNARRPKAAELPAVYAHFIGSDWSWCFKLDNRAQLEADPRSDVAESLLALCGSSRYFAARFLDMNRHGSDVPLHFTRDIFWLPDDLVQYTDIISDSSFRTDRDEPRLAFHITSDIKPTKVASAFDILPEIGYTMIGLDAFEQALLWADPSYEWCGHVDIETFRKQKECMLHLFCEFGYFPDLIVMVDVPRGDISWSKVQVVGMDDPALYEMSARGGPHRYLSAYRHYEAFLENLREGYIADLDMDDSSDGDQLTSVMGLELPRWMSEAGKLSFAFSKPRESL